MAKNKNKQDNMVLWVLLGILLVCFIVIGFLFYKYFYAGTSSTKYGDRLDGIENHVLNKNLESDVNSLYKDIPSVNKATIDVKGKIIYIVVDFKESIKVISAQDIAMKALSKISDEDLKFYEIQFILTYSGSEDNENYPVFGSKNANSLKVVW